MKKVLCCIFCVLLVLSLSSCGEPPTVNSSFDGNFTVTQADICYKGTLSVTDSSMKIELSEPYTVSGLCFDYGENGLSISEGGLCTQVNCDYISSFAVPSVLHNTLTYLPQASYIRSDAENDSFSLPTPYGESNITATNGVPKTLYDPHSGLSFDFSAANGE